MDAILEAFDHYLDASTPENFLVLRAALAASPAYHPNGDRRSDAEELMGAEKWDDALRLLMQDMDNCFLTPRCHFLAAFAAHKTGDEKKAQVENRVGNLLMQAILESGDGTKARPYLVSRITDEYDVLHHLNKNLKQQSLVSDETGTFDNMECDDGTDYWFDISMLFVRLNELNKGGGTEQGPQGSGGVVADFTPPPPAPAAQKPPWWRFGRN